MTLNDVIDLMPPDLRMAVEAGFEDPGFRCGCEEMRSAVKALRDRRKVSDDQLVEWEEQITAWIGIQEFVQMLAAEVSAEIEEAFPVDINEDVLPEWIVEWWAPVLRNPWSERLDEAVIAAKEWLEGQ